MKSREEKLAASLTANSTELLPFLPRLLQDLWELGSSPDQIAGLIGSHLPNPSMARILDLACGKGAVSVRLAKRFGCRVKGIDLMPEFIKDAREKAAEHGVAHLCSFAAGDVNAAVLTERGYNALIFGAAGDILGSPEETVTLLAGVVNYGGIIILDDACAKDGVQSEYPTLAEWEGIFTRAGTKLLEAKFADKDELRRVNDANNAAIAKRANELAAKYPEKAELFESYVKSQLDECRELENDIEPVVFALKKLA